MIHVGRKYLLDGITEVLIIKSFERSLAKILIELPDKVMMLVKQSRLLPLSNLQ